MHQRLEIRASSSERYRRLLSLARSARERRDRGQSILEGEHLLQAWLDSGGALLDEVALPRRSLGRTALEALCARASRLTLVLDDELFDRLSQVEHGPGPLAVIPVSQPTLPMALQFDAVYLDGVQDPGNAGTVMRSALAFGVRWVLASTDTVGLWSPKVLRAAMGAHFGLSIVESVGASDLLARCGAARPTAADPRGSTRLDQADLSVPRVWIFGAEGRGISKDLGSAPTVDRVAIPHTQDVESLNVAVAAAVCLYEQYRRRIR